MRAANCSRFEIASAWLRASDSLKLLQRHLFSQNVVHETRLQVRDAEPLALHAEQMSVRVQVPCEGSVAQVGFMQSVDLSVLMISGTGLCLTCLSLLARGSWYLFGKRVTVGPFYRDLDVDAAGLRLAEGWNVLRWRRETAAWPRKAVRQHRASCPRRLQNWPLEAQFTPSFPLKKRTASDDDQRVFSRNLFIAVWPLSKHAPSP